jgi:hypothetical protein
MAWTLQVQPRRAASLKNRPQNVACLGAQGRSLHSNLSSRYPALTHRSSNCAAFIQQMQLNPQRTGSKCGGYAGVQHCAPTEGSGNFRATTVLHHRFVASAAHEPM